MEQKMAGSENQIFLGNRGYCLRMRMYDFVRNLLLLSFVEIIEPNFMQLMKNVDIAESVVELFGFHDEFLSQCLTETLLLFGNSKDGGARMNTMFITVSIGEY